MATNNLPEKPSGEDVEGLRLAMVLAENDRLRAQVTEANTRAQQAAGEAATLRAQLGEYPALVNIRHRARRLRQGDNLLAAKVAGIILGEEQ